MNILYTCVVLDGRGNTLSRTNYKEGDIDPFIVTALANHSRIDMIKPVGGRTVWSKFDQDELGQRVREARATKRAVDKRR